VAVAGTRAELVPDQFVGVHRETHGAAGGAPLEAGLGENLVDSLLLAEVIDDLGPGDGDGGDARGHLAALEEFRGLAKIGNAAVGATADETDIDRGARDGSASLQLHVLERLADALAL